MKVGLVGVGLMGQGIALNLIKGGHALRFLDHPGNQPVTEIIAGGGEACSSLAELAEGCEAVILCVTGSSQVEEVLTGTGGLLGSIAPGTVILDCSTSLPESTLAMAAATERAGGAFLDAPMTRTAAHAQAGTLNLLIGGREEHLARVRPLLESFTEGVLHVGPVGTGHRLKLLHNFVSIGFMTLLAEAAAQSADAGVPPEMLVKVLAEGGGNSVALDRLKPFILESDPSGLPFALSNALKDISYYAEMSEAAEARSDVAEGVRETLLREVEKGAGDLWLPELIRLLQTGRN